MGNKMDESLKETDATLEEIKKRQRRPTMN
jgi:hypothetical protein